METASKHAFLCQKWFCCDKFHQIITHISTMAKSKVVYSCRHYLHPAVRAVIKWLHDEHKFAQQYLADRFNVARTTVMRCIKGETKWAARGRKRISPAKQQARKKKIQKVLEKRGPTGQRLHPSSRAVANVLKKQYPTEPWSKTTVLRVVKKTGGKFFTMPSVPFLNKTQREERLTFATRFKNITQPMIFVDEAWITVNSSTKKGIYWWPQETEYVASPEDFNRNDQFPTKLFVFGAVGHNFKFLRVVRWEPKNRQNDDGEDKKKRKGMGEDLYVTRCLAGTVMRQLKATNSILIQDNAPAHNGNRTKKYLAKNEVERLPLRLPAKSCDLNIPIERTWANLKRLVQADACDTIEELEASVLKNWDLLSQSTINKMVTAAAWKERCKDVIEAGGWYTWGKRPKAVLPT